MNGSSGEIIGLDLGSKRTGIARASAVAKLPEPMMSVETDKAIETVKRIGEETKLEAVVVGLPRNLRGEDTDQTRWVRRWVAEAKDNINAPFFWQDEALTSVAAENQSPEKDMDIDAQAAAFILQDFLDTPVERRVAC